MKNPVNLVSYALNYGAAIGLILCLMAYISYTSSLAVWVLLFMCSFLVYFIAVPVALKRFRNAVLDGYIKFSKAFSFSGLLVLSTSFVLSFFNYAYFSWINSTWYADRRETFELMLYEAQYSDEMVVQSLTELEKAFEPTTMAMTTFFWFSLLGIIVGLISSGVLQKEPPIFDSEE